MVQGECNRPTDPSRISTIGIVWNTYQRTAWLWTDIGVRKGRQEEEPKTTAITLFIILSSWPSNRKFCFVLAHKNVPREHNIWAPYFPALCYNRLLCVRTLSSMVHHEPWIGDFHSSTAICLSKKWENMHFLKLLCIQITRKRIINNTHLNK